MSKELDELMTPPQADPGSTPDEKVGKLVNENAELRRRQDELEARIASMAQPRREEPRVVRDQNEEAWNQWAGQVRREAGDEQAWLTDPGSSFERGLKIAGKSLVEHTQQISRTEALNAAGAMRADMEFSSHYPDLMATEMGSEAVRRAILKVRTDPKFQQALSRSATRSRAFQMIAKEAKSMIPGSPQTEELEEELPPAPRPRKGVFAETGGRITSVGPTPLTEDEDKNAINKIVDHMRSRNRA